MNWISPIASGNDIKSYIKGTTVFVGDSSKCIKATSSSTWTSAFKRQYSTAQFNRGNYHGTFKTNPSKDYVDKNLVRFQDIDLTSITDKITSVTPGNPGTPVTPKV